MVFSSSQKRLFKRLLLLLPIYSLLRIGFFYYHYRTYRQFTYDEIGTSFLLGLRFDLAAISLLNIPIVLLALVPVFGNKFMKSERILYCFLNLVGISFSLIDYELFYFMGKRFSFDLFAVAGDIAQQFGQILIHFWFVPFLSISSVFGMYFLDKKLFPIRKEDFRLKKVLGGGALTLLITFILIRGGLQGKSINVQSAFVQGKNELGHLVLNSPYHFLRTLRNQTIERVTYFKTDAEAKSIILNERVFEDGLKGVAKANVVLVILESFSLEYVDQGYAPFLSELRKTAFDFPKHLANGRRSVEALPSILCGLPSLLFDPISKSNFQGNKFNCLPATLKSAGYKTHFFHAGAKGTMGFDAFTLAHGVDAYHAMEDYPNQKDYDGTWGIFDGPYLSYVGQELSKESQPFFATVFTLTSHQPYAIPAELVGKFPKGTLEIHESIGYTDYALRTFFEKIKDTPWFKNTLFVITADHTQKLESKKYENIVGRYRVPLLFYFPGFNWGSLRDKVTQHSDIPKTILDFVEVPGEVNGIGTSAFSKDRGLALNFADGRDYYVLRDNLITELDKSFIYVWETGEFSPTTSDNHLLKAYLQYFTNGLLSNNLSLQR